MNANRRETGDLMLVQTRVSQFGPNLYPRVFKQQCLDTILGDCSVHTTKLRQISQVNIVDRSR